MSTSTPISQTLVIDTPYGVDSFDPAVTMFLTDLVAQVYQPLVYMPQNSSEILPLLAQNYSASADGLTYTFWLKQNIQFSNGDPFNAYVVWYNLYRDWAIESYAAEHISPPLNMSGVTAGQLNEFTATNNVPPQDALQITHNPSLAVTVLNPYEVQFHLSAPFQAFMYELATHVEFVDPRIISENGGVVEGQPSTFAANGVGDIGTGPYMITEYLPNTDFTYTRNPIYWGGANGIEPTPHINKVIFRIVPNGATRLQDLARGSAQYALIDYGLVPSLPSLQNVYVPHIGALVYQYIGINTYKFPTSNLLFREAIAHALNFSDIATLYMGHAAALEQPIPNGAPGYDPSLVPYSYDLSQSRSLLAQMGYPNGTGLPTLVMLFPTDVSQGNLLAQYVEAQLGQIGVNVVLRGMADSDMEAYMATNKPANSTNYPSLSLDFWGGPPNPYQFAPWIVGPLCYSWCNSMRYNNPEVNSLLTQANAATSSTTSLQLYMQASKIVHDDLPYIWVQETGVTDYGIPVASNNLRGFGLNSYMYVIGIDLSQVYFVQ